MALELDVLLGRAFRYYYGNAPITGIFQQQYVELVRQTQCFKGSVKASADVDCLWMVEADIVVAIFTRSLLIHGHMNPFILIFPNCENSLVRNIVTSIIKCNRTSSHLDRCSSGINNVVERFQPPMPKCGWDLSWKMLQVRSH